MTQQSTQTQRSADRLWFSDERGQAILEFALVLPILLFLLFAMFTVGYWMNAQQIVTQTAQQVSQYVNDAAHDPNIVLQDGQKLVNAAVEWTKKSSDYEKGKLVGNVGGEIALAFVGVGEARGAMAVAEVGLKAGAKVETKILMKEVAQTAEKTFVKESAELVTSERKMNFGPGAAHVDEPVFGGKTSSYASQQASLTKIQVGETVNGLSVTQHAADQAALRGVTRAQIQEAIEKGTAYTDQASGTLLFVLETSIGKGFSIVTNVDRTKLITVMDFVRKATPSRFTPLK